MIKGLNTDSSPINQPEGSYRHAVNNILKDVDGGIGSLTSEPGNTLCFSVPVTQVIIGSIPLGNTNIVFLYDDATPGSEFLEIGVLDNCVYTQSLVTTCTGYNRNSIIKGKAVINSDCEREIVFGDGINDDLLINLDRLEDYYSDAHQAFLDGGGTPGSFVGEEFNCNLFRLVPNYKPAYVTSAETLDFGGTLELGSYWLALRYISNDGNRTNIFHRSNMAVVTADSINTNPNYIDGGYNVASGQTPEIGAVFPVNKSIRFNIENIDTTYDQIEPIIIKSVSGDGLTRTAYRLPAKDITQASMDYVYTGYEIEQVPLEEVQTESVTYHRSQGIEIIGDRLVRGNVSEKYRDWSVFQAMANNINIYWDTELMGTPYSSVLPSGSFSSGQDTTMYKTTNGTFSLKTMPTDEVVALGIMCVFKDGTKSPVFHIPGRAKITDPTLVAEGNANTHNRNNVTTTDWDDQLLTVVGSAIGVADDEIYEPNVEHLGLTAGQTVERWKVYNTAIQRVSNNEMGYYETEALYPDTLGCDGLPIYPYTGSGPFVMDKIRHHRLPDATLQGRVRNTLGTLSTDYLPLSLNVQNVILPTDFEDEIEGWQIVMARPDELNKTIVARGIMERTIHGVRHFPGWGDNDDPADITETYIMQSPLFNYETDDGARQRFESFLPVGTSSSGVDLTSFSWQGDEHYSLYTPEGMFNEAPVQGTYIKTEEIYTGIPKVHEYFDQKDGKFQPIADEKWFTASVDLTSDTSSNIRPRLQTHRTIQRNEWVRFQDVIASDSLSNPALRSVANQDNQIIKLDNLQPPTANPVVVTYNGQTATDVEGNGGGNPGVAEGYGYPASPTSSDTQHYDYVNIKVTRLNAYSDLPNLEYIQIHSDIKTGTSAGVAGGSNYIGRFGVRKTYSTGDKTFSFSNIGRKGKRTIGNFLLNLVPFGVLFNLKSDLLRAYHAHLWFDVESEINVGMRHEGDLQAYGYIDSNDRSVNTAPPEENEIPVVNINSYYPKSYGVEGMRNYLAMPTNYLNYYDVNLDYSMQNDIVVFRPVLTDLCDECQGDYTNRIVWTEPGEYRTNLALNSTDINQAKGPIIDIISHRNNLLIRSEYSLYIKPANYQQLQVNDNTVFTGTGGFLAIPEQELTETANGFIGCKGRLHTLQTDYGVAMIDEPGRRVFLYDGKLNNLSAKGMYKWFKRNLTILNKTYSSYNTIATDYPVLMQLGYDPVQNRLFVTKRDYDGDPNVDRNTVTQDHFTISYDLDLGVWDSFHTYHPRYTMYNNEQFLTSLNASMYSHSEDSNICTFYNNTNYDIKELVVPFQGEKTLQSIYLLADFFDYDSTNEDWYSNRSIDLTDMKLWVRNSKQSTGINDIQDKNIVGEYTARATDTYVINDMRNGFAINKLWDLHQGSGAVVNRDRDLIKSNPITQTANTEIGYDDIIPTAVGELDYEAYPIRGRYGIIRLYYKPESTEDNTYISKKFSLYLLDTIKNMSI